VSDERDPERKSRTPDGAPQPDAADETDDRPLTGEPVAPMRLRPEPPRVTRLSRKVLAGLGLVASLGVGGALIYALQTRNAGNQGQELYSTDNRTTPDGLPVCRRTIAAFPDSARRCPAISAARSSTRRMAASRFRRRASPQQRPPAPARRSSAARRSWKRPAPRGCSPPRRRGPPAPQQPRLRRARAATDLASLGLAPQPATPSAQDRQLAFLNQPPDKRTVSPDRVAAPASANVLQAGAVISAALITGIRSDLPGQITAQVTENVYDSPTGRSC
jgi:type IV secretion system protein VirB10